MLNEIQQRQLKSLAATKATQIVEISPFDPKSREIANQLLGQVKQKLPRAKVFYHGSTAMEIAGMNDIDVSVVSGGTFDEDKEMLDELFQGKQTQEYNGQFIQWEFDLDGFWVELALYDYVDDQLAAELEVYCKIKKSQALREEYERLKVDMNGKTFIDYKIAKCHFFNRVSAVAG